ncbi:MAG: nucleotidyltransferase domain-containing protein [Bacillota bacterium]
MVLAIIGSWVFLPELVRINLEPVIQQVRAVLSEFPQVAGAYLFGSAMESCRPDSDIDLGLILEPEVKPDTREGEHLGV